MIVNSKYNKKIALGGMFITFVTNNVTLDHIKFLTVFIHDNQLCKATKSLIKPTILTLMNKLSNNEVNIY